MLCLFFEPIALLLFSSDTSATCPSDSMFLTNPRTYLQNAEFSTETATFKGEKPPGVRHFVR